jgi:hypothetical protein
MNPHINGPISLPPAIAIMYHPNKLPLSCVKNKSFTRPAATASDAEPANAAMILLHNKLVKSSATAPHKNERQSNKVEKTKTGLFPK